MTVYNGVAYLREAIESVLDQTFGDFEFLIIDDASTDDSVDVIRSYADARIRLILNEANLGQAASLNKGLEIARGQYIARLDQDDACLPERLAAQVRLHESRPDVVVSCTWEHTIDDGGRPVREWRARIDNFGSYVGVLALGLVPVWHPSAMFRRESVVDLGGYDPSFAPAEDYELWSRIALSRGNGAIVPEYLVLQRVHGARQSVTRRSVQETNTRRAHEKFIDEFSEPADAEALGLLLRLETGFWKSCRARGLPQTLDALRAMLDTIVRKLELNGTEATSLRRTIYNRLGPGVRLGAEARIPSLLLYPALIGLSPMLVSPLRKAAAFLKRTLPELRYRLLGAIGH